MNVTGFKMITGEDVIAESKFNDVDGRFTLRNPVRVYFQNQEGDISLAPWPAFSKMFKDKEMLIGALTVAYVYEPDTTISEKYIEIFGGIPIPPNTTPKGPLQLIKG